ncbi:uracil-DNA glycosylase family protein [Caldimonas brevitalea]|uniref:Uracil-DNA glycosylase-like domain-containing protein n=1 Tax=Caldimonas brevitalea TaxID=413882 RepID=A0A0G3BBP7_9BURK|nr:uracil-DNA glycosylase family protein [Caldimonas brevitalea]AKJ26737.1 hypothetical protein AAW51_0046 [Caldimonas brevitalea]
MDEIARLLADVQGCTLCAAHLPHGPRPVLQLHPDARILIAAQAPGRKVHETGIPFNDASGERLRHWMGVDRATFYDARRIAIVPMGLCFPGSARQGDLPPRRECAPQWRTRLLQPLRQLQLTLVVGRYAQSWHLSDAGRGVTEVVQGWREHLPTVIPLPHPSPRNQLWVRRHPWFEAELLPVLRERVAEVLTR